MKTKKITIKVYNAASKNFFIVEAIPTHEMIETLITHLGVPISTCRKLENSKEYIKAIMAIDVDYYDAPRSESVIIDGYEFVFEYHFKVGVSVSKR